MEYKSLYRIHMYINILLWFTSTGMVITIRETKMRHADIEVYCKASNGCTADSIRSAKHMLLEVEEE